jgi:peptide/nickel transport system permease protein
MTRYLIRRLLQTVPIIVLISIIVFVLIQLTPGGPMAAFEENPNLTPADLARLEEQLGLNQPIHVKYLQWAAKIVQGDWGFSQTSRRPVLEEIGARLPNTLQLMFMSYVITILIAIPIGIYSALKQYSLIDHLMTAFAYIGQAVPVFWFGLILIIVFHVFAHYPVDSSGNFAISYIWDCDACKPLFPGGGMNTYGLDDPPLTNRIYHLILPVTMLSIVGIGTYTRYMRGSMLEVIHQDYVRTARAKGLRERLIITRHCLKNAALPVVTIMALQLPALFGGALFTETIFSWPGIARLFFRAAQRVDYPLLMGIILINSLLIIFFNLVADVFYAYLDPRIRYE